MEGDKTTHLYLARDCKFVSYYDGTGKKGDGLLEGYDWMQGIEEVTYPKIINE
jgi:hypothetical protein